MFAVLDSVVHEKGSKSDKVQNGKNHLIDHALTLSRMDLVGCWALPLSELISIIWCMRFGREFAAFVLDKPHSCMAKHMQKHLPIHKQSSMGVRWDKTVSK